ncbi:hypothetical protein PR048_021871 [Dryococelus australis]|uniref:Uncharacterized protein n=1 Tax=Dryococelus australis TaxID=614101 RepID=A0ABQ9GZI4_9NEOP|nr:hypothetical protein PR048_021871 [Dryococelus australis]
MLCTVCPSVSLYEDPRRGEAIKMQKLRQPGKYGWEQASQPKSSESTRHTDLDHQPTSTSQSILRNTDTSSGDQYTNSQLPRMNENVVVDEASDTQLKTSQSIWEDVVPASATQSKLPQKEDGHALQGRCDNMLRGGTGGRAASKLCAILDETRFKEVFEDTVTNTKISNHLQHLSDEFSLRYFPNSFDNDIYRLVTDPFHVDIASQPETLQEQALEIKYDSVAKYDFEKIDETLLWVKYFKVYPDIAKQALRFRETAEHQVAARATRPAGVKSADCEHRCSEERYWQAGLLNWMKRVLSSSALLNLQLRRDDLGSGSEFLQKRCSTNTTPADEKSEEAVQVLNNVNHTATSDDGWQLYVTSVTQPRLGKGTMLKTGAECAIPALRERAKDQGTRSSPAIQCWSPSREDGSRYSGTLACNREVTGIYWWSKITLLSGLWSFPSQTKRHVLRSNALIEHVFRGCNNDFDNEKVLELQPYTLSDGMVKRLNCTLEQYLSIFVVDNEKDSDSKVPLFLLAYHPVQKYTRLTDWFTKQEFQKIPLFQNPLNIFQKMVFSQSHFCGVFLFFTGMLPSEFWIHKVCDDMWWLASLLKSFLEVMMIRLQNIKGYLHKCSVCPPFVTRHTSNLYSISAHTRPSVQGVTIRAAAVMRCRKSARVSSPVTVTDTGVAPGQRLPHCISNDAAMSHSDEIPAVSFQLRHEPQLRHVEIGHTADSSLSKEEEAINCLVGHGIEHPWKKFLSTPEMAAPLWTCDVTTHQPQKRHFNLLSPQSGEIRNERCSSAQINIPLCWKVTLPPHPEELLIGSFSERPALARAERADILEGDSQEVKHQSQTIEAVPQQISPLIPLEHASILDKHLGAYWSGYDPDGERLAQLERSPPIARATPVDIVPSQAPITSKVELPNFCVIKLTSGKTVWVRLPPKAVPRPRAAPPLSDYIPVRRPTRPARITLIHPARKLELPGQETTSFRLTLGFDSPCFRWIPTIKWPPTTPKPSMTRRAQNASHLRHGALCVACWGAALARASWPASATRRTSSARSFSHTLDWYQNVADDIRMKAVLGRNGLHVTNVVHSVHQRCDQLISYMTMLFWRALGPATRRNDKDFPGVCHSCRYTGLYITSHGIFHLALPDFITGLAIGPVLFSVADSYWLSYLANHIAVSELAGIPARTPRLIEASTRTKYGSRYRVISALVNHVLAPVVAKGK